MKEPRYDVYRLEVFRPILRGTWGITFGGELLIDVVIPELEVLRQHVYDALMHCCGELWVTHLGERRLVMTCAQFEDEYGWGKDN